MSGQACPNCAARSDDGLLCSACTQRVVNNLNEIPGLMRELETTLTRQGQTGTGNGGKGAERPLPFDVNASDVSDSVHTTLRMWCDIFAVDDKPHGDHKTYTMWMLERLYWIRGHADVIEFMDELQYAVSILRRCIDRRPDKVYLGVCETRIDQDDDGQPIECGHQMYAQPKDEGHECRECHTLYVIADRKAELLTRSREHLGTVGTCAQVLGMFGLPVRSHTIHNWTRPREYKGQTFPPKLWRRGINDNGQALYMVGEVEELAREAIARTNQRAR